MSEEMKLAVMAGLREVCVSQKSAETVLPEFMATDTMLGTLGISSLQLIELIFELEVRFSLQVDEEQLVQLQTVADVIALFDSAQRIASAQETSS